MKSSGFSSTGYIMDQKKKIKPFAKETEKHHGWQHCFPTFYPLPLLTQGGKY